MVIIEYEHKIQYISLSIIPLNLNFIFMVYYDLFLFFLGYWNKKIFLTKPLLMKIEKHIDRYSFIGIYVLPQISWNNIYRYIYI